ncbi:phospholipase-like protein [Tanacetum coccineum]
MKDRGISLEEYEECLSSSPHFPQYLYHLRDQCVTGVEGKILATHIKPMLNGMSIGDDEGNLLFKKLMIYYLIEEVLLCEANSTRVPRAKTWHLVQDIERCESVNWPKAIDQHLRRALVGCQDWDKQGGVGEHSFEGAMPVLEAVIYNRIRKIQPKLFAQESPPIQKYVGQRKKDVADVLSLLKASDILPCPHCTAPSGSVAVENTPDSGSPLAVTPEDSLAGQLTDLSLSFGDAKLVQAVPRDVSSNLSGVICAKGYKVKNVNAPILEAIIKKHGDIASTCVFPDAALRTSLLDVVCEIVGRIETNDAANIISQMEEIESQLSAAEAAKINVSWLRASLNAIHKRNEAGKKVTLLMEMKTNTFLVKRAARNDLVAAENQLADAKRCVEVLNLVEKMVNKNFLESKAERDLLAGHPII